MSSSRIVVFSHIPKTAGTSLNLLLRRHFGVSHLDATYRKDALNAAYYPKDLRRDVLIYPNLKLIAGHCMKPFVDFEEFSNRMDWITFLRDPVKRYVSHYAHEQTHKGKQDRLDLKSWQRTKQRRNWMVEMLAGEQNLEKAKDILHRQFKFVGCTEEFETSLKMMKVSLRLERFETQLTAPQMAAPDPSIKEEVYGNFDKYADCILSSNELDNHLYNYFRAEIWESQKELLQKNSAENFQPVTKLNIRNDWNQFVGKIKRNFLYKPFVKVRDSPLVLNSTSNAGSATPERNSKGS